MSFTTVSIRVDTARKLKAVKLPNESYSELFERLLENQPAKNVGDWLDSLAPLVGRGVFSEKGRAQLKRDQQQPRASTRKRRAVA